MLTFRNTNLLLGISLLALLAADHYAYTPWWAYTLLLFGYSWVVFYGVYFIQSGFFMPTLYRGPGDERAIALSFDDGPSPDYTPRVLDILKEHSVQAAFFCIGKNVAGNEVLLRRIAAEGHIIGNHSFTHDTWFDLFPAAKMAEELAQTNRAIEAVIQQGPRYFRPPYGVINPLVREAVRRSGHLVIGWSLRSYDTMIGDNHTLMQRLMRLLHPGAVVLLHEHGKKTIEVLPEFIRAARTQGYRIERLDQLLNVPPYV